MPRKTNFSVNGSDYSRVRATVGKKSDGTAIIKAFYGTSKKEAEAKRDAYLQGIKKGLAVGHDKLTFGAAFKEWFEHVHKPKLAISSATRYETDYRLRVLPSLLCNMRIVDVKTLDVQRFYNGLLGEGASVNSVRTVHKLLSAFYRYAVKSDLVIKNPLLAVERPKERKVQTIKAYLNKADIAKVVSDARFNPDSRIFVFLIFSGLRSGEALALTHADIADGNITVNKSVNFLMVDGSYTPVISTTKTTGSTRIVPLFKELRPLLKVHRVHEMERCLKLGIPFSECNTLFTSYSGGYIEGRNLRRRWKRLCTRLGIEETTVHALRHTFCSLLAENGVNLKTASELMGHMDTKTTMKIYTHVQQEEKIKGIATLSSVYPQRYRQ